MEILLIGILVFLFFLSLSFTWSFRKNDFTKLMRQEAKRCLNNYEDDGTYSSKGRVYTKGFAVIEKNGEKKFIKQAKLCDMGLLE